MSDFLPFNKRDRNFLGADDFSNMFDNFLGDRWLGKHLTFNAFRIDVKETDAEYIVEAELPGVKKEEIELSLEEHTLCISVKREEKTEESKKGYVHQERHTSSMRRSLLLPDSTSDKIQAKLNDGVLTVNVPRIKKSDKSNKINIE